MSWLEQPFRESPNDLDSVEDVEKVVAAASLLEIREFDLFHLAWKQWHGEEPDEKGLEKVFVRYLYKRELPYWVRHFVRRVNDDAATGRLDPVRLGAARYPRREGLVPLDLDVPSVAAFGILVLLLILA